MTSLQLWNLTRKTMETIRWMVISGSAALSLCIAAVAPCSDDPRQTEGQFETTVSTKVRMGYLLYLPKDYATQKSWPLMVFLHGAGERGSELNVVKKHGPPKLIEAGKD